ncbi:MAG TPA: hypothetical protein VNB64_05050 [Solirubrobacteraceae bacterium]|nr:hypothetical protein [Solirubrobacteraceae bacterium]
METALFQWSEGLRRLREADPLYRPAQERVVERIVEELRRRLGSRFTTAELAELYDQGTDWCLEIAQATAPEDPRAWDVSTVGDAAFGRYVRAASDYAGGRVVARER